MMITLPWQSSPGLTLLLLSLSSSPVPGECGPGAAASGAIYALGGGGRGERMRDEEVEALVTLVTAGAVVGVILVVIIHYSYKLVKRYVFKIQEPSKNFVMEKKVKCKTGEERINLRSVSSASLLQATT